MSDYMFMLDNHLSSDQSRVVNQVQGAAAEAGCSLFLTGGAMRDMLGGFLIRDLDFSVEGAAVKLAQALQAQGAARIVNLDENRKSAELVFAGGVTAEIAATRPERAAKSGGRLQLPAATIHEDLRCRDFTVNAMALSLNRASRGLLLDPTNGLADLQRKELRAVNNYALYDDPIRLLRLVRLRVRLGFAVEERTAQQYLNARQAEAEAGIGAKALMTELRHIAAEPAPAEVVKALDEENLLRLFAAATGDKLNLSGLARLQKAKQLIPFDTGFRVDDLGLFLFFLTEKLTPRDRNSLIAATAMPKDDVDLWQKLEARARKLERQIKSTRLQKPSQVYSVLSRASGDEVLFLYVRSAVRLVQDRVRNYLQKYLPAAQEVTEQDVLATGAKPNTPKFNKAREELIAARLDSRTRKVPMPAPEPPPAPVRRSRRAFER